LVDGCDSSDIISKSGLVEKGKMLPKLKKEIKKPNFDYFFLLLLLMVGAALRLANLDGITFGHDQARDAYRIRSIVKDKDFKLLGPETDIPGVHHGPLFYYLVALPYVLFKGDPRAPVILVIFINLLGVPLIYFTSLKIFKNRLVALLSSLLYTFSYEVFEVSRWLSNPSPSLITLLLFFLGLWLWIERDKRWWLFTSIGLGLSIQFQFVFVYLFGLAVLIFFLFCPKVKSGEWLRLLLALFLILSSFVIAEFKFKFMTTKVLVSFVSIQKSHFLPIVEYFDHYLNSLARTLIDNIFAWNTVFALFLFLFAIFYLYKYVEKSEKRALDFTVLWFFSTAPLYAFSIGTVFTTYLNMGIALASFVLLARFIEKLISRKNFLLGLTLLTLSFAGNSTLILPTFKRGTTLSAPSKSHYLKNEKRVVDYMYREANGQPFSFCSVTAPLFNNVVWSYVFETYGEAKYGYLPFWSGPTQEEFDYLPPDKEHVNLRFLLVESVPLAAGGARITRLHENLVSQIIERQEFDGIEIEKRLLLNDEDREETKKKFFMEMTVEQAGDWQALTKDPRYSCFH